MHVLDRRSIRTVVPHRLCGWLLPAVALLILLGCSEAEEPPGADEDENGKPTRSEPVAELEPSVLEVVNSSEIAVEVHDGSGSVVLELEPHGIGRLEFARNEPVQLYVPRGRAQGLPNPGIEFVPRGPSRYIWDLTGQGRYVTSAIRQGAPGARFEPPPPSDRFEREGVYVFRAEYGLLDAAVEIEPRRGRAPRKVYRQLADGEGDIGEVSVEELGAILFRHPEAHIPRELAGLVPLAIEAWPDEYGTRLLPLVRTGGDRVIRAVTDALAEHPDPSLARQLRNRLVALGEQSVPATKRRAYARILAACGTRSDLEAAWNATTHHVGRRHLLTALREETGQAVVEFFLGRLLSDDASLVHEAWEYLLEPEVLRDPSVLTTAKLHLETDWTITQESREEQYRRLLNAAFRARARSPRYPRQLVDWLMLESLHRLDIEQARVAIEYYADRREAGIPVLHEAFAYLPASKRRDLIARPLIDQHELYPELKALLFDAMHDPYWEDIARPATRRLVRDNRMLEPAFRDKVRERIDEIERPYNKYRAIALYQEGWRSFLMNATPEQLGMSEEERREQLRTWILEGIDSTVARQSYESLWKLLEQAERKELLHTLVEHYDELGPENRAVILYALIDHLRLQRDHQREPWLEEATIRGLLEQALSDSAPGVREIAFGTLVLDREWYHEPRVKRLLDEALLNEPIGAKHEAFTAMMLAREAREAVRRVREGDRIAREFLASLLHAPHDEVVVAAIDGLAGAGCEEAVNLLALQYFSLSRRMRMRALLVMAEASSPPVEIFVEAARSESGAERRMVYRALLKRLDRTADDYLAELLGKLIAQEPDADLREDFSEWHSAYRAEPERGKMPSWPRSR